MTGKKFTARWGVLALIVFVVILSRLIPYVLEFEDIFNFAPLAAIALFGGAYFSNKSHAIMFPLLALWISNLVLDNIFLAEYYEGFALFANWEVYFSILLIIGLAMVVLKKVTLPRVIGASLGASILFFLVTNGVIWFKNYPVTYAGFIECFTLAIPFFRNTVTSDLFYSVLFFAAFEWVANKYPKAVLVNS